MDDVISSIIPLIKKPSKKSIPYKCFNVGNGKPKSLKYFLKLIEKNLILKSKIINLPLQKGDIKKTHADIKALTLYTSYKPKTDVTKGIELFINWFKKYHMVK